MGKRGIRYVINDSWEAGAQNWTDDMIADFTRLRGYDPHPWLPVLAGHVVESAQASDQFLWDLRKTIADLTATEHYGQLEATLKERGHGPLWRVARVRARLHRRWHGGEEVRRHSHERDVGAGARASTRNCTATTRTIANPRRSRTFMGRTWRRRSR